MKPEFELLVRACGMARGLPVNRPVMQTTFPDNFDQKLFVDMAIQHKTATTAYAGLKKLGLSLEPEQAARLKRRAAEMRMLRGLIVEEACKITEALSAHGIPALVIKGPALSLELYGNPYEREYNDLDILVNTKDVEPLFPLMTEAGYHVRDYYPTKNPDGSENRFLRRNHHLVFMYENDRFKVEIHDRIGWEEEIFPRENIDSIFSNSIVLKDEGKHFSSLPLSDHAPLLVAHGTEHGWCLLHWVLDAAAVFNLDDESLHRSIAARIRSLDLVCQLKLTCDLVQTLFPIELPSSLKAVCFSSNNLKKPLQLALRWLEGGGKEMDSSINHYIYFHILYEFPLFHGLKKKTASIRKTFKIQPRDAQALPLPKPLMFLHFLFRPFFVASRRIKANQHKRAKSHA